MIMCQVITTKMPEFITLFVHIFPYNLPKSHNIKLKIWKPDVKNSFLRDALTINYLALENETRSEYGT